VTTSKDGATEPRPGDTPNPTEGQQQEPPAEGQETVVDQDEQDVIAARTAAEAENPAGKGGEGEEPAPGAQPADKTKKPDEPAAAAPGGEKPIMIPKERFDEVLTGRDKALQDAAYWRGQAEARAQREGKPNGQDPNAQGGQTQQPTAEALLTEIHAAQDALAAKFDSGEITMADFKRQERELNQREQGIREEALLAKVKPATAPAPGDNKLYLDTLTAQLEEAHPWSYVFESVGTPADWDWVQAKAIENLVGRGIDPRSGDVGTYELRKEMAVIMDQVGPYLLTDKAKAKGIELPGQSQPPQGDRQQQQPKPVLSRDAQNRADKLALRQQTPPALRGGSVENVGGVPSEGSLETMDEEAIGNLPDATRRKLLGITA